MEKRSTITIVNFFMYAHVNVQLLSHGQFFAIPWTVACQAPLPWDFPGKNTRVDSSSRGPSQPSNRTHISCISCIETRCQVGFFFYHCATRGCPIALYIFRIKSFKSSLFVCVKIEKQLIHLTEFGNIMYMGQKGNGYSRKKNNFLSI